MTECTVADHVAELAQAARRAYLDGKHAGSIEGHEAGHIAGYVAGHHDGTHSTVTYRRGYGDGWQAGYIDCISDERAQEFKREAA